MTSEQVDADLGPLAADRFDGPAEIAREAVADAHKTPCCNPAALLFMPNPRLGDERLDFEIGKFDRPALSKRGSCSRAQYAAHVFKRKDRLGRLAANEQP